MEAAVELADEENIDVGEDGDSYKLDPTRGYSASAAIKSSNHNMPSIRDVVTWPQSGATRPATSPKL